MRSKIPPLLSVTSSPPCAEWKAVLPEVYLSPCASASLLRSTRIQGVRLPRARPPPDSDRKSSLSAAPTVDEIDLDAMFPAAQAHTSALSNDRSVSPSCAATCNGCNYIHIPPPPLPPSIVTLSFLIMFSDPPSYMGQSIILPIPICLARSLIHPPSSAQCPACARHIQSMNRIRLNSLMH